ncbi:MAG: glycosyltransferase family 2 protein [Alphaproteobacteria bacterium]|nr:glycosyltransferase family 2 protein [Alphaproteobacteria bacterium]
MVAISVILPVYNVEKYLQRCLDSISNQTFDDFEIIAVNDGSKDSCLNILQEHAKKENRLQIISQDNKGLSEARNTGLMHANGEYIYFLDSDDAIHPQCLEIAYEFIKKYNAELICFGYEHSDGLGYKTKPFDFDSINCEITSNPLLKGKNKAQFNVWTKLYKRELICDIRFIAGINFEDYPYAYELYSKHPRTVFLDTPLYFYTRNEASLSKQTSRPSHIKDYTTGILRVCDIYADDNLKEDREFIKIDFIPAILKHQIGRIRRASKANKKEMIKLFRAQLLELKRRNMISFRGHKLKNWLTYQWLLLNR